MKSLLLLSGTLYINLNNFISTLLPHWLHSCIFLFFTWQRKKIVLKYIYKCLDCKIWFFTLASCVWKTHTNFFHSLALSKRIPLHFYDKIKKVERNFFHTAKIWWRILTWSNLKYNIFLWKIQMSFCHLSFFMFYSCFPITIHKFVLIRI